MEHLGSVVEVHGLSCPSACGILVPRPGIEPMSSVLAGGFLTPGPQGNPETIKILQRVGQKSMRIEYLLAQIGTNVFKTFLCLVMYNSFWELKIFPTSVTGI